MLTIYFVFSLHSFRQANTHPSITLLQKEVSSLSQLKKLAFVPAYVVKLTYSILCHYAKKSFILMAPLTIIETDQHSSLSSYLYHIGACDLSHPEGYGKGKERYGLEAAPGHPDFRSAKLRLSLWSPGFDNVIKLFPFVNYEFL
jgi:hypothetical protein